MNDKACTHRYSTEEWMWLDDGDGEWIEYSESTFEAIDHETYRCTQCGAVEHYVMPENSIP